MPEILSKWEGPFVIVEMYRSGAIKIGSYMSYCILFWGPSTVLRAFLSFMKSRGFGPFSQVYELLYTIFGSVDSFEGIFWWS